MCLAVERPERGYVDLCRFLLCLHRLLKDLGPKKTASGHGVSEETTWTFEGLSDFLKRKDKSWWELWCFFLSFQTLKRPFVGDDVFPEFRKQKDFKHSFVDGLPIGLSRRSKHLGTSLCFWATNSSSRFPGCFGQDECWLRLFRGEVFHHILHPQPFLGRLDDLAVFFSLCCQRLLEGLLLLRFGVFLSQLFFSPNALNAIHFKGFEDVQ